MIIIITASKNRWSSTFWLWKVNNWSSVCGNTLVMAATVRRAEMRTPRFTNLLLLTIFKICYNVYIFFWQFMTIFKILDKFDNFDNCYYCNLRCEHPGLQICWTDNLKSFLNYFQKYFGFLPRSVWPSLDCFGPTDHCRCAHPGNITHI